ncbi:uncharacterized protein LOC114719473 [Neltuma alba]|uniref:uncharacterized protein LOC114719473 n=1 Tax=Neltuma alba TaxID=207710 RepID=UPI0010A44F7E|nr:uncharacterized protein LOC114719473 [Prosopis alba]
MIVASWNCRGAGNRAFPQLIKDIVRRKNIDILCLIEPRISGQKADKVVRKLGFSHWIRVEATGFAGAIWVCWNEGDIKIEYISSTEQLLHCKVGRKNSNQCGFVSFIYGEPNYLKRGNLWQTIRTIAEHTTDAWLLVGDFNVIRHPRDRVGGAVPNTNSMDAFNNCLEETGLVELRDPHDHFTWEREFIKEKLDWVFCNFQWENMFPHTAVKHDLAYK